MLRYTVFVPERTSGGLDHHERGNGGLLRSSQAGNEGALATTAAHLDEDASTARGFIASNLSVFNHETLDWAVVITFRSRDLLSVFLESEGTEKFLTALKRQEFEVEEKPLIIEEGIKPPRGPPSSCTG